MTNPGTAAFGGVQAGIVGTDPGLSPSFATPLGSRALPPRMPRFRNYFRPHGDTSSPVVSPMSRSSFFHRVQHITNSWRRCMVWTGQDQLIGQMKPDRVGSAPHWATRISLD